MNTVVHLKGIFKSKFFLWTKLEKVPMTTFLHIKVKEEKKVCRLK